MVDGSSDPSASLESSALCAEFTPHILNIMLHMTGSVHDAEDLTQEVFLIAVQRLKAGEVVRNPKAWLQTIALRVVTNARRTRWFKGIFGNSGIPDPMVDWKSPDVLHDRRETGRELYRMLDRLTEKKRTVFILHEMLEMTCPEIAVSVDCPVNTVYARLRHARSELLEMIKKSRLAEPPGDGGCRVDFASDWLVRRLRRE